MTLDTYHTYIKTIGFEEYPLGFFADAKHLHHFINYNDADIDLKTYLTKLILCRSFYGTYISYYADVKWFIDSFFQDYTKDAIRPALSNTIKEAAQMIMAEKPFTKGIIGTTFMFGIIEFYAKFKLGFRPLKYNFFDPARKEYIKRIIPKVKGKDLSIKSAFISLQQQNLPISMCLNEIDDYTESRLKSAWIEESDQKGIKYTIADRLAYPRNPMLHGELHSFYEKGPYLLMLYILFHFYELKFE